MAYAQSVDFQRPASQLSIDRKPTFFSDEFDTTDEPFMESTMISPAAHPDDRRDSFGNSTAAVFSPQSTAWDDFSHTPVISERQFAASTNPFLEHSTNPFLRQDAAAFNAQHASQWPNFDHPSESRGPMVPATYEGFNTADFESTPSSAFPHSAGPFGPMPTANVRPASVFPPSQTPVPMSPPPGGKDWMAMADQGHMDARLPKRLRGQSPQRGYPPNYRSGDGIRKKNARFDIPQERNLANIDRLIENAKDEDEVKELKQQKRLLRNRQAALDSRQRKKQRAEELEEDNKNLREQMALMNEELSMLKLEVDSTSHTKSDMIHENAELQKRIQHYEWEKENLIVEHTNETAELRKKIIVLQDIVAANDTARPQSANYDFPITHDMSGLTVDPLDMNEWGDPFAEFMDSEATLDNNKPLQTSLVLAPKKKVDEAKDESGPSGLLMLLLLCGAWVASKATTSMPVTIPRMPEEVRSDAAVVFDDLMKDHGVSTFQSTGALASAVSSAANVRQLPFQMSGPSANSRLDNMHNQLTRPSKRQEAEAAFSLSVKQYESLTSAEFTEPPYNTPSEDESSSSPSHRRHLVDTLRAMREDVKGHSSANVYTRSLLWERLSDDVVQQFKRMADESSRSVSVSGDGAAD